MDMLKIVAEIREFHRRRDDYLRAEGNLTRQIKSMLRRLICHKYDLSPFRKGEGAIINPMSDVLYKTLEVQLKGCRRKIGPDSDGRAAAIYEEALYAVEVLMLSEYQIHQPRIFAEKQLIKMASTLPVVPWVESIKGLGIKGVGLGQIVGEAGDLSKYPSKAALWKRMGVAVFDGQRQRKTTDKVLAELYGYSPKRRSILFGLGESMIKAQGTYVPVYYREKERQLALHPELLDKKGGKGHISNRARRYMEKLMLRDLWQVWTGRKPIDYVPHGDAWPVPSVVADKANTTTIGQAV